MAIQLFLDLNNLEYYGYIPEVPDNSEGRIEEFHFINGDEDYLKDDIDEIDSICGALLDIGDVDYFNCEKCAKLKDWVDERLQKPVVPRYREILGVLRDYCQRAIALKTGVVIEL